MPLLCTKKQQITYTLFFTANKATFHEVYFACFYCCSLQYSSSNAMMIVYHSVTWAPSIIMNYPVETKETQTNFASRNKVSERI